MSTTESQAKKKKISMVLSQTKLDILYHRQSKYVLYSIVSFQSMPKYVIPPKTDKYPNNYRLSERDPLWNKSQGNYNSTFMQNIHIYSMYTHDYHYSFHPLDEYYRVSPVLGVILIKGNKDDNYTTIYCTPICTGVILVIMASKANSNKHPLQ